MAATGVLEAVACAELVETSFAGADTMTVRVLVLVRPEMPVTT